MKSHFSILSIDISMICAEKMIKMHLGYVRNTSVLQTQYMEVLLFNVGGLNFILFKVLSLIFKALSLFLTMSKKSETAVLSPSPERIIQVELNWTRNKSGMFMAT